MSLVKITEITAQSEKGFEDAIKNGIERFSSSVENVEGAWVKEQKVVVSNGKVTKYRVTLKISFVVNK
jgi:flavin-binding protein dodecin